VNNEGLEFSKPKRKAALFPDEDNEGENAAS